MKIALCFSGQPRFLDECYESIYKNLIEGYNVDVYCHGWWDESYEGKTITWYSKEKYQGNAKDRFCELYKPKKVLFEPQIDFSDNLRSYDTSSNFANIPDSEADIFIKKNLFIHLSQFYSVMMADSLRRSSGIKYDLVVRCRTDLLFSKKIKWEEFSDRDLLYVADGRPFAGWGPFCDWFAFGSQKAILSFANLYNIYPLFNRKGLMHIHQFVELALRSQGQNCKIIDSGCAPYRGHQQNDKLKDTLSYLNDRITGDKNDWPYFSNLIFNDGEENGN